MAEPLDAAQSTEGELSSHWFENLLAEAIGTFTLIFVGISSIVMTHDPATGQSNLVAVGLAHGLAIALMVAATGHISGGAFNPAVTLGLWVTRRLSTVRAIYYILAQLTAALLAAWAVTAVFSGDMTNAADFGVPAVGHGFTPANAFIAEIITTFFLVYVIFGVAIDKRGPSTIAGLAIGLTITMDIYATGAVSGAAMNPARWFGPALIHGVYRDCWIWIAAPAIGAVLAAVVYQYIYLRSTKR